MKKKISITLDVALVKKIEKICNEEYRTISNMINILLKQVLKEDE